jgi:hypothetical protein
MSYFENQHLILPGEFIEFLSDGRLVYGGRPNNASDYEEFLEIWEQLKVKTCTSLNLHVEMPEYDLSMNIPQRYYLETNMSTIFISKVYERILTISLSDAIATLFKLPDIAMRIDKY